MDGAATPVKEVGRFDPAAPTKPWVLEEDIPLESFRFQGVSYQHPDKPAIYLFGGQGRFVPDADADQAALGKGFFPVVNSTIRYVPVSVARRHMKLDGAAIAGIVIAVVIAAGVIFAGLLAYIGYRNRGVRTSCIPLLSNEHKYNIGILACSTLPRASL